MKRFYSLLIVCMTLSVSAEVITMDLATATDAVSTPVAFSTQYGTGYYDLTDVWDGTYNDNWENQYLYTNNGHFVLSHMPSMQSYGGMSWEGFTLSKVSQDTANVFGCVANGGVDGVGTPYVIGYFSEWVTESLGHSSNLILFDHYYYPEYVYICQNSNTMEAIANGGVFNARAFTDKDTLALVISALNSNLEEVQSMTYYLAVDGKKNTGWVRVPLTTLSKAAGLSFRMTTTDMGDYGSNTPLYFALDGLTVNTEKATDLQSVYGALSEPCGKIVMVDARVMISYEGKLYTLMGQRVK